MRVYCHAKVFGLVGLTSFFQVWMVSSYIKCFCPEIHYLTKLRITPSPTEETYFFFGCLSMQLYVPYSFMISWCYSQRRWWTNEFHSYLYDEGSSTGSAWIVLQLGQKKRKMITDTLLTYVLLYEHDYAVPLKNTITAPIFWSLFLKMLYLKLR